MDIDELDGRADSVGAREMSRGSFLARSAALGLALSPVAGLLAESGFARAGRAAATELTILDWGPPYSTALQKWVVQPFNKANDTSATFEEQAKASDSLAKIQAAKGKPTVDVWMTTGALPLLLAKAGGLQELTPALVPNLKDLVPLAVQRYKGKTYGVGTHLGAECILVDNKRIKSLIPDYHPSMLRSWKFLYRPELKDNIAIAGFGSGYGSFMIAMSKPYGGSERNEAKFFAAMKKLAPNVHTIPSTSYVPLFQTGEIVASMGTPVDAQQLVAAGAPIDIGYPIDPLAVFLDYAVAIKNAPSGPELPQKLINDLIAPSTLAGYDGQLGFNSPNRKSVQPVLKGLPRLSAATIAKSGWLIDYDVAVKNYDSWNQRFETEIVPLFGK